MTRAKKNWLALKQGGSSSLSGRNGLHSGPFMHFPGVLRQMEVPPSGGSLRSPCSFDVAFGQCSSEVLEGLGTIIRIFLQTLKDQFIERFRDVYGKEEREES